ncbi:MAG: aminopeptidase P family protein [Bacteroidales bacterium]|nr:aminopeptidase P family protein [Bacteroidales bacterium]
MNTNDKIIKLREQMALYQLDAFIVYTADPHGSEYPAEHWKFREYLSGFNGSAGTLVVTKNHAGLWTDSRYFIQAEKQLRGSCIELHKMGMPGVPDYISYLTYLLPSGSTVGVDGFTLSMTEYRALHRTLANFGIDLNIKLDFAQELFVGRPTLPTDELWFVPQQFEGQTRQQKVALVRQKMKAMGATHYLVSALDNIAWLINMRAADVEFNPVFYAYMIITPDEEHLYIDPHKLTTAASKQLEADGITVSLYEHFERNLGNIPAGSRIFFDPNQANARNILALPQETIKVEGRSIVTTLKAIKSPFEIEHMEQAHVRDAVALVRFARWLYQTVGHERVTELDVCRRLTEERSKEAHYISDSFATIAGYGPNGAIVHYEPTIESNATLEPQGLLLLDSGAQYVDGTTDITRTFALGPVTDKERLHYTLTLKGTIGLACAIFPEGTRGTQLDTFARQSMWRYGVDYGHGTGHGVGYCLNVHEGPQNISKKPIDVAIEAGMITSDEPGIYVEGSHGVRIENLTVCVEAKKTDFGTFLGFKTITLFPIDKAPIMVELLSPQELKWLNDYHAQILSTLSPHLQGPDLEWLKEACAPLS